MELVVFDVGRGGDVQLSSYSKRPGILKVGTSANILCLRRDTLSLSFLICGSLKDSLALVHGHVFCWDTSYRNLSRLSSLFFSSACFIDKFLATVIETGAPAVFDSATFRHLTELNGR